MIAFFGVGEGECYMIVQQATRWLLKHHAALSARGWGDAGFRKKAGRNLRFLQPASALDAESCAATTAEQLLDPAVQLHALAHRAARLVGSAAAAEAEARARAVAGSGPARPADSAQWLGIRAAFAFGDWLIARSFAEALPAVPATARRVNTTYRQHRCFSVSRCLFERSSCSEESGFPKHGANLATCAQVYTARVLTPPVLLSSCHRPVLRRLCALFNLWTLQRNLAALLWAPESGVYADALSGPRTKKHELEFPLKWGVIVALCLP